MGTPALGPYIALYAKEVLGDVNIASLKDDQFGRLVRYWCVLSEIGGRLPGDPAEIARRSRIDVRKVRADVLWFPRFFFYDISDNTWRSDRIEKQAAKYAQKVDRARNHGNHAYPEMGDVPAPEFDPYVGADKRPEMGANSDPDLGDIAGGTQTQIQSLKSTPSPNCPPTPHAAAGGAAAEEGGVPPKAPKRTRQQKQADSLLAVEDVTEADIKAGTTLRDCWRKNDPLDGRIITCDMGKLVPRLASIRMRQPLFTLEVLVQAGQAYCANKLQRYKSPEYFFSLQAEPHSSKPPFHEIASAIVNRNRMKASAPAPIPLVPEGQSRPITA